MISVKIPQENKDPIRAVFDLDNLHYVGLKGIDVIINGKTLSFSKDNVEWILNYLLDMGLSKEREIYRFIRYLINEYSAYDYLGIKIPQEKWDDLLKDFESYEKDTNV